MMWTLLIACASPSGRAADPADPPPAPAAEPVAEAPAPEADGAKLGLRAVGDGVDSGVVAHGELRYRVVRIDLRQARLDLVGQGRRGQPRSIEEVDQQLASEGRRRVVATNAGIFHPGHRPAGLHVEDGEIVTPLDLGDGGGNFYLKPNGVFHVDRDGAHVVDAARWRPTDGLRLATQSGPALLIDGALHPRLKPDSTSLKLRSAVCPSDPHTVHLVLSEGLVRFYDLAVFLRDGLGCRDALYLDGTISRLWAPDLPDDGLVTRFAGFLVVTEPAP